MAFSVGISFAKVISPFPKRSVSGPSQPHLDSKRMTVTNGID